jgi:hypothetical protein
VPVPIDPAAAIRGDPDHGASAASPVIAIEPALTFPEEPAMPETPPVAITAPAEPPTIVPTPPGSDSNSPVTQTPEANRAMPQTPPLTPQPAPPVAAVTSSSDPAGEAVRAERDRIAALGPVLTASRALVPAGTGDALHQRAIAEGWSADALRGALWDAMVQGARPPAIPAAPQSPASAQDDPVALREANLATGRAAVMKQKTLDGLPISIGNSMRLLVGPNQELAARQLTVAVQATQTSNANVYAGFIQPLVEPLIPANRWYLFADPITAPVYVYGFLNGAEGPQVTTGPVSGVDGVEVSVIFDFGVGAIDWRGAWFNAGT